MFAYILAKLAQAAPIFILKGVYMANYAILRFQKYKAGGVAGIDRHNERKKSCYKSNPNIDP